MESILILASMAIGIVSGTAHDGSRHLRLPLRSRNPQISVSGEPSKSTEFETVFMSFTQKHVLSPYTVQIGIGTPIQYVELAIDAFSDGIWVNPTCSSSMEPRGCCANGNYNYNWSSTVESIDCSTEPWVYSSHYGETASGCTYVDYINFAAADLGYMKIDVASESWGFSSGSLGLGFGCKAGDEKTVIERIKARGYIDHLQFSVHLGSAIEFEDGRDDEVSDQSDGELMFSGIDTKKYYLTLTAIGYTEWNSCNRYTYFPNSTYTALDFTQIISRLPGRYMVYLAEIFPDAQYNNDEGYWEVPCRHRDRDATVDFNFDTHRIAVPMHDFILEYNGTCFLGAIATQDDQLSVLGLSFLRGAYVAFDIEHEDIYLAQYQNCGQNILGWDSSSPYQPGLCTPAATDFPPSCSSTSLTSSTSPRSHSTTSIHLFVPLIQPYVHVDLHLQTHVEAKLNPLFDTSIDEDINHLFHPFFHPFFHSFFISFFNPFLHTLNHIIHKDSNIKFKKIHVHANDIHKQSHRATNNTSGVSSLAWTQTSGFSWSNVSFTPSSGMTPIPTSGFSSFPESSLRARPTLTSVEGWTTSSTSSHSTRSTHSTSSADTSTSKSKSTSSSSHSRPTIFSLSSRRFDGTISTVNRDQKTVTVTVGVVTSTVFMPSPITMPASAACNCLGTHEARYPDMLPSSPASMSVCATKYVTVVSTVTLYVTVDTVHTVTDTITDTITVTPTSVEPTTEVLTIVVSTIDEKVNRAATAELVPVI
ncbi:aspartic peptidase domain-containing protein [Xylariaceae sp. FL1019]|nr:aspartic peptidase domain-containing protein [Xylariaceae sp. FL1019]